MFRRLALGVVFAGLALGTAACGGVREEKLSDSGNSLEGTVKYGGEQLQFAMIIMSGAGSSGGASVDEDGRYKANNLPVGEVKIGINTQAAMGTFQSRSRAAGLYKGTEGKGKIPKELKFIDVPAKYADPNTSGIMTTIKPGANTFDIVIPK